MIDEEVRDMADDLEVAAGSAVLRSLARSSTALPVPVPPPCSRPHATMTDALHPPYASLPPPHAESGGWRWPRATPNQQLRHSALDFFFQAEDGIRDTSVTGVQTCALPI